MVISRIRFSGTVSGSHVYADDGPYTITVTVTDSEGASSSDSLAVTVSNVTPTVNAGADQFVAVGATVSLDPATFNDLGTLDTHTATISWGDGSPTEAGTVIEFPFGPPGSTVGADGSVSGSHVYSSNGVYTVTVTVTDDEATLGSDLLQVTVTTPNFVLTSSCTGGGGGSMASSTYQLDPGVIGQSVTGTADSPSYQLEAGCAAQVAEE